MCVLSHKLEVYYLLDKVMKTINNLNYQTLAEQHI